MTPRRILIARHGRPDCDSSRRVAPRDMEQWIDSYSRAGIASGDVPSTTIDAARSSGIIVSSTSPRSLRSAERLDGGAGFLAEDLFREAALPHTLWRAPRLPANVWAACFRVAWFCGYTAQAESVEHARTRAQAAAERLVELAEGNGSVFLVGHGIMTRLIATRLRRLGWRGPARPAHGYWRFSVYER